MGPFVPEVVLDHPDLVLKMHEEFVHAGSDVVEAFTVRELYKFLTSHTLVRIIHLNIQEKFGSVDE